MSSVPEEFQVCTKCGESKPLEEFAWALKSENRRHKGCKSCSRDKYRVLHPEAKTYREPETGIPEGWKRCTKCTDLKLHGEFHKSSREKDGYNYWCKKCMRKYSQENMPVIAARAKTWSDNNPERTSQAMKDFKTRNKTRTSEEIMLDTCRVHPSGLKECVSCREKKSFQDFSTNRFRTDGLQDKCKTCRRPNQRKIGNFHSRGLYSCVYCPNGSFEQADHVWPVSKGGLTVMENLVPTCKKCNLSKLAMDPWKWLERCYPNQPHEPLLDSWGVDWRTWPNSTYRQSLGL